MNLAEKFLTVLKEFPQYRAVVKPGCIWNYEELDQAIRQVQKQLKSYNLIPQTVIALLIDDPLWLTASIWSVIRERLIYVVLDGTYPQERLAYILEDCQASLLIIDEEMRSGHRELINSVPHHVINLEGLPLSPEIAYLHSGKEEDIVTLYYTSGSTGKPKGVIHNHATISHEVRIHTATLKITPNDRFSAIYSLATIGSNRDFYAALLNGASWNFFPFRLHGTAALKDWIKNQEITILHAIPMLFRELNKTCSQGDFYRVRVVFLAGDRVLPHDVILFRENFPASASFYTGIGASEATSIYTHWFVPREESLDYNYLPSGYPIPEKEIFLVNDDREQLSSDEVGEIAVCSYYLSPGYFGKEELTRKSFAKREDGAAIYFTGDQGRFDERGRLVFIGRKDDQVKINGFRVELAEVEAVLKQHPQVDAAVVIGKEQEKGEKKLVAYVVTLASIDNTRLREYIRQKLPDYMVPAIFVILDNLPLTPNGKIDRKALPSPEEVALSKDYIAPRTPGEEIIAHIFASVLGMPAGEIHDNCFKMGETSLQTTQLTSRREPLLKLERVGIHDNFFALGGHSLLATQVVSRMRQAFQVEIPLNYLFELPTIAQLSQRLETIVQSNLPPILTALRDGNLALSFAQQRLWFLEQLEPGNFTYNIPAAYRFTGLLNITALEQSLKEIVQRHEILRTSFPSVDGQPHQAIATSLPLTLSVLDLQGLSTTEREVEVNRQAIAAAQQPFDLAKGPLFRFKLLRLADDDQVLLLNLHHIISDGWSFKVFFQELTTLYKAFSTDQPAPLPELPIQYADFAHWQHEWLQGEVLESQLSYWKQQLRGNLPILQLPTDYPRPPVQTYPGAYQPLELSPDLTQALQNLSQQEGVTLFMTLLTAFQTLLSRYSAQEDIIVGTPIAGRNQVETENLIGFFVNTLAIRTNLSGNPSFRQLLSQVRQVTLEAYNHQDLPLEKLIEELNPERDMSRSPLFQVMFAFQNIPSQPWDIPGVTITPLEVHSGTSKFDLTLDLRETSEGIKGGIEYNTDLFEAATITRMLGHFQTLLEGIVTNPEQCLSVLPLLTPTEQHQLLVEWNNTQTEYSNNISVHQLFEEQVALNPDAIAIVFEEEKLTYRELNNRANQLAHYLQKLGVKPEVLVGICLERSPLMLVALLAILKAGGAYVPLDPDYPAERLNYMISDAQLRILLTQQKLVSQLPEQCAEKICLDSDWSLIEGESQDNLLSIVEGENLAYVIYTSGSTGKPKGVQISHRGVVNFLSSMKAAPGLSEKDIILAVTSISFDIAALELYLPLSIGAQIILVSRVIAADGIQLMAQLNDSEATVMQATPATWQMLLVSGWEGKPNLKIFCGGEALQTELAYQLQRRSAALCNLYGPTETTIWSTFYQFNFLRETNQKPYLAIGRPIANTQIYLLDHHLKLVPIGVQGELYIGGDGLARGYLNRRELTEEKFIANPFSRSKGVGEQGSRGRKEDESSHRERLYKTGDLARYLPDGNIEFLGRIDNQVKIRGFRIELGEIEAVLSQHPSVAQTVVIDREDTPGNKRLVAYVVCSDQSSSQKSKLVVSPSYHQNQLGESIPNQLRDFLKQKLPKYMIPSAFVLLETLPLTPNGKIDRRALPATEQTRLETEETFVAPRDELELQLTKIWEKILDIQTIGVKDNFFNLGGHSLLAVKLFAQMEKVFKINLPLTTLFQSPTVEQIASILREKEVSSPYSSLVPIQVGESKPPLFLIAQGATTALQYVSLTRNLSPQQPVYCLQAPGIDKDLVSVPPQRLEEIAAYYLQEIQIVQPEGPYQLGGRCALGSIVAFEIAQQLLAQGEKVNLLAMLDPGVDTFQGFFADYETRLARLFSPTRTPKYYVNRFLYYWQNRHFKRYIKFRVKNWKNQLTNTLDKMPGGRKITEQIVPLHVRRIATVFDGYYQAFLNYHPQLYPGKITLFICEDWLQNLPLYQNWQEVAAGGLEIHECPGTHLTMLDEPDVQQLAAKLQACLDSASFPNLHNFVT